mmetsp:Transcript_14111/g.26402  ORF Transcript_14111/g.26402 Transcript_14111/m.26402 type:complete len:218 (-) Transcript_14111:299-952(-)
MARKLAQTTGSNLSASQPSLRSTLKSERDPAELRSLEQSWDSTHWMHYSRRNPALTVNCRDYFDRPRVEEKYVRGLQLGARLQVSWKLGPEEKDWSSTFGRSRSSGFGGRSCSGKPEFALQEANWDDSHHILHSAANTELHESDKEYFSVYLAPRSKRVVPKRQNGITQHLFPHRQRGNPDGMDDAEMPCEILRRMDNTIPVPSMPGHLLRELLGNI